jgi:pimeloyl-ACP methyl ester carboxylesterase
MEARYAPPDFPVRIVWGEEDAWIPLEQGQALAERIAHGKLIRVPHAAHLVQEDAPEAIVAAVLDR